MKILIPSSRQRAVALVVTLIMLSLITVITFAFLAVTSRETKSVSNAGQQRTALRMAESGLEHARAAAMAHARGESNRLGPDLIVSVNVDGNTNTFDEATMAALRVEPRVPVFVMTNSSAPLDFRFWLDLDRNGIFSDTGDDVPVYDEFRTQLYETNLVGDPQWIGVLEDPTQPHGRENRFIGRYAFIIVPAGKTLDLNFIHNNAKGLADSFRRTESPGFLRNQGVGSWEANLAAFLADLNTNQWGTYLYNLDAVTPSAGLSFDDASELLAYRYDGSYTKLFTAEDLFQGVASVFTGDLIDGYANGPIPPFTSSLLAAEDQNDNPTMPWPGSDSLNHFFSVHDFFNTSGSLNYSNFVGRLRNATIGQSTYDETTFYRLLSQLGTDSAPEEEDPFRRPINLNYVGTQSTNLVEWDNAEFFLTVADRLLEDEFGDEISVTRIPVYTNLTSRNTNGVRFYSPRIHQLLQIAANITDARRADKEGESYPFYPSVFRPQFEVSGPPLNEIYITNYVEEPDYSVGGLKAQYGTSWYDIDDPFDTSNMAPEGNPDVNFYGIPTIIGAKKGFPSFNEFTTLTTVQVGRKLEFRKTMVTDQSPNETNQMFTIGISNVIAAEVWNSYSNAYPRPLEMVVANVMITQLTNDAGFVLTRRLATSFATNYAAGSWLGRGPNGTRAESYKVTPPALHVTLPDSVYYLNPPRFEPISATNRFERNQGIYTNQWALNITNRLLYFLYDNDRLVDMVAFSDLDASFNVSEELAKSGGSTQLDDLWDNTPVRNVNVGVDTQIEASMGNITGVNWNDFGAADASMGGGNVQLAIDKFRKFMDSRLSGLTYPTNDLSSQSLIAQAPFTPVKKMYAISSWEVNDPLVNDLVGYLKDETNTLVTGAYATPKAVVDIMRESESLGRLNKRYKPWGREDRDNVVSQSANDMNPSVKDPMVTDSDAWNFPEGKFPTIGWLGRVHRGTPWQTVYLKATEPGSRTWQEQVGAAYMEYDNGDRPTSPVNDWRLVDLFTAALHPNATRGTLSINQEGLAAWSAVLSGVPVTTLEENSGGVFLAETVIEPAVNDYPVEEIVAAIQEERESQPNDRFERLGDVLATKALTEDSPFLNEPYISVAADDLKSQILTDEDYERIPQQILSLLKVGDARFVVYTFGQSLMPAPSSVVPAGANFGMVTNYQVTGEASSRAVIRLDFEDDLEGDPDVTTARPRIETFNNLAIE